MSFARLKQILRQLAVETLRRTLHTPEGRRTLTDALAGLLIAPPTVSPASWLEAAREYPNLAQAPLEHTLANRPDPIFITARFRSGSTLLWNLFRHLPNCTAYYEPLNERRWFDPQSRGTHVDASHLNVQDYWREYAGLEHLGQCFRDDWNERRFYMDAHASDTRLLTYLRTLIDYAPGQAVLQFNRVDFRLPWLKYHFPKAKLVHLVRHPRAGWYSSLMSKDRCPRDITISQFAAYDELYLLHWVKDLQPCFPILADTALKHPYQLYYCLWKLSYAFGMEYADYHLTYEDLVNDPESQLSQLLVQLDLNPSLAVELAKLVEPARQSSWHNYADGTWFLEQEAVCERLLAEYYPRHSQRQLAARAESGA